MAVSETRTQLPTSIPTDHSGLQQQRQNPAEQPAVQRPLQQEPREQEQEQQQTLQPEERTSGSTSFRCPSNRHTQIPDAATLVVESGNATPNNDGDNSTTRSIHASGDSGPTPAVQNPAIDTHTNTTTTTTTIVITSGEKVSRCYSPAEDQPLSVEEQRGYNRGGIRGRRGSRGGRKLAWKDNAGELAGEGSEEEEMAGAGAETGAGAGEFPPISNPNTPNLGLMFLASRSVSSAIILVEMGIARLAHGCRVQDTEREGCPLASHTLPSWPSTLFLFCSIRASNAP